MACFISRASSLTEVHRDPCSPWCHSFYQGLVSTRQPVFLPAAQYHELCNAKVLKLHSSKLEKSSIDWTDHKAFFLTILQVVLQQIPSNKNVCCVRKTNQEFPKSGMAKDVFRFSCTFSILTNCHCLNVSQIAPVVPKDPSCRN